MLGLVYDQNLVSVSATETEIQFQCRNFLCLYRNFPPFFFPWFFCQTHADENRGKSKRTKNNMRKTRRRFTSKKGSTPHKNTQFSDWTHKEQHPQDPPRHQQKFYRTPKQGRTFVQSNTRTNRRGDAKVMSQSKKLTPRAENCPKTRTNTDDTKSCRRPAPPGAQHLRLSTISPPRITSGTSGSLDDRPLRFRWPATRRTHHVVSSIK